MKVGTIKETKTEEHRVGLTPSGARSLVNAGHEVFVERGAGIDSGFPDEDYTAGGATIAGSASQVAGAVELIVKVKEPQPAEYPFFKPSLIMFTYLHLAPLPELTRALLDARVTAIAYETVEMEDGSLPLLTPMSQVAGRMAAEIAAQYLKRPGPGRGKLLGGIPLTEPASCVIIGSGTVASYACRTLLGLEATVTVFGREPQSLNRLTDHLRGSVATRVLTPEALAEALEGADVLISGVLVRGGVAPKLVTREMVRSMGPGAVIVDVSIDQGGVAETSRPTNHSEPTYVEEGVIHYCVPNMPGAVPRTSTEALTAVTLPYVLALANQGLAAVRADPALAKGVNTIEGQLTLQPVAVAQGLLYTPLEKVFA